MSYGYSKDLKEKVLSFIDAGNQIVYTCKVFSVSRSAVYSWLRKRKRGESLAIQPRSRAPLKIDGDKLQSYINRNPDHYLREIGEHFGATPAGVCVALKRLKITRKKRHLHTEKKMNKKEVNL